jgi:RNA polymerase sigma-70 factor (ECF subfamily)
MAITSEAVSSSIGITGRAFSNGIDHDLKGFRNLADREMLFHRLVLDYRLNLYHFVRKRIANPDDAADIVQQAFLEAMRSIGNYRGKSTIHTWLFGIAKNLMKNYLTRAPQYLYKFENEESLISLAEPSVEPSEYLSQKEMLGLIFDALAELPDEIGETLSMIAVDEIPYQEVANRLGIPLGTVRSRVFRARAKLRLRLEEAGLGLTL